MTEDVEVFGQAWNHTAKRDLIDSNARTESLENPYIVYILNSTVKF